MTHQERRCVASSTTRTMALLLFKKKGSRFLPLCMFLLHCTLSKSFNWNSPRFSVFRHRHHQSLTAMATTSSPTTNPLTSRNLPSPLILGSASFTRKLILKEMGVPFFILVRPIDEKGLGDRSRDAPADLVLTLAKAKMEHLVHEIQANHCQEELKEAFGDDTTKSHPSMIVLTGDQVVTCDGAILEKPESVDEARAFVSKYGSTPPSTVGSCVLTHLPSGIQVSGVDTATIHFKADTPASLVDTLVAEDAPVLSCAGGLMVEHPAVKEYIARIDGTEDSVMGLSKDLVLRLLDELAEKLKTA